MANEKNLIPFTSDQSHDEAVKNGKKGGVASGAARRRRKTMRQTLNALLGAGLDVSEQEFVEKVTPRLLALGIDVEDATYQDVMLAGIVVSLGVSGTMVIRESSLFAISFLSVSSEMDPFISTGGAFLSLAALAVGSSILAVSIPSCG